ncbi:MAG: hypothetical protein ABH858_01000 [Candidatus Omnitrophota bacterium]
MIEKGMFTSIGSWPHTDIDAITELIINNFTCMPAWPQLPKTGFYENMYVQYSQAFPCIVIDDKNEKIYFDTSGDVFSAIQTVYEHYLSQDYDYFAISQEYAKGLYSFRSKLRNKAKLPMIKGQALGPVSFGLTLTDENKRLIIYDEQMQDALVKACVCKAVWQARFLKPLADKIVIFIDEPYLVSFGSAYINVSRQQIIDMINEVIDSLRAEDVFTGIHCCGSTDWSIVIDTNVDILNFDAYNYSESIMIYPEKINEFLIKGNYIAWGIVPTAEDKIDSETPDSLLSRLTGQQKKLISLGVDKTNLLKRAVFTPSCGTGSLSERSAERAIELLKGVSLLYREKY